MTQTEIIELILKDYLFPLFYIKFTQNATRLRKRVDQQGTGGSVVEFSPATWEARVRFPVNVFLFNMDFLI